MISQQYAEQKVASASPMELILLLFDGACNYLTGALESFEIEDEIQQRNVLNENVIRAQEFITELACSLDMQKGGEMAQNLARLYDFMGRHLIEANTTGTRRPIEQVREILGELRDGWAQAIESMPRDQLQQESQVPERKERFQFIG